MATTSSIIAGLFAKLDSKAAQSTSISASTTAAASTSNSTSSNIFGNATVVTLSPPAQAIVSTQSQTSGSSSTASAPPAKSSAPVSVPVSTSSSSDTLLQQLAVQQLIPQVGVVGANEVVDKSGNIDHALLAQLLAQQSAQTNITA